MKGQRTATKSSRHSPQLEKAHTQQQRPNAAKKKKPKKTVWRFLRKLKIELPYDLAIPLLGIYPDKTIIQKDTCTPMFIAVLYS